MKFLINLLAAILLLSGAQAQAAGSVSGVTITQTMVDSLGHFYFHFSSPVGGSPPGCATATQWMTVDGTTTAGAAFVANVLAWYSLGKTVNGVGTGTCYGIYEIASNFSSTN